MAEKYKLDNGLTVLLEPVKDVASVSVGLWINAGSRDENENQYGYAHFVEHMLFKGTSNYSAKEIAKQVDRIGGQHNAATNREYTCYYINVIADYIELAIEILSDMYFNSLFDEHELEKEKNVIIEEIRMYEDTPDEIIHDIFTEKMLMGHPLSHSILGNIDEIKNTTKNKLLEFYNSHYKNNNAIFVIAGSFKVDNTKKLIASYFNNALNTDSLNYKEKNFTAERLYQHHIDRDLEQVHFCLGTEGIKRDDESRWPLYSLSTVLGGNMSSRLFQNIREKEGISYSIYSFHSSYKDNGIFGIYCATSPDKFSRAVELIIKECRDIITSSISESELNDAKTYLKGNLSLSFESIEVRMGQLARNEMIFGEIIGFNDIIDKVNNIKLDDFKSITKDILENKKFSIVSVGKLKDSKLIKLNLQL